MYRESTYAARYCDYCGNWQRLEQGLPNYSMKRGKTLNVGTVPTDTRILVSTSTMWKPEAPTCTFWM